jgi:hypothetical protein
MITECFAVVLLTLPLAAQDIEIPESLSRTLAERAVESVSVNLDSKTLQLAGQFLSSAKPEEARIRELVGGIRNITVRSFEFDKPGQYTEADLAAVRRQLSAPVWSRIVSVASKRDGERTEIYTKSEAGKAGGVVILAAETKELTIVSIAGHVDLSRLSELGGRFGIPRLQAEKEPKKKD